MKKIFLPSAYRYNVHSTCAFVIGQLAAMNDPVYLKHVPVIPVNYFWLAVAALICDFPYNDTGCFFRLPAIFPFVL